MKSKGIKYQKIDEIKRRTLGVDFFLDLPMAAKELGFKGRKKGKTAEP